MTQEQFTVVFFFTMASGIVPVILYVIRWQHVPREIHYIAISVGLSLISDIACYEMSIRGIYNMLVTNTYFLTEYVLIGFFFYDIFFKRLYKKVFFAGLVVFILAFLWISIFIQPYTMVHQNFVWASGKLVLLIYALVFIHEWAMSGREGRQYRAHLWIIGGMVFHYAFSVYIVFVHQFSAIDMKMNRMIWSFHNLSYAIKHLLFGVAIYTIPGKITLFAGLKKEEAAVHDTELARESPLNQ